VLEKCLLEKAANDRHWNANKRRLSTLIVYGLLLVVIEYYAEGRLEARLGYRKLSDARLTLRQLIPTTSKFVACAVDVASVFIMETMLMTDDGVLFVETRRHFFGIIIKKL
jgi:hypothetical protein